jgi:6-phosphogluconolactonase
MNLVMVRTNEELANCVAKLTAEILKTAIDEFEEATWVLSGGTSPTQSYDVVAKRYSGYLDWEKVWFLIGDERHVPTHDPYSNWGKIESWLLRELVFKYDHKLTPTYKEDLTEMAKHYSEALSNRLPKAANGRPRFDLVWLGLGEDGHTLALFPGYDLSTSNMMSVIKTSPKPPPERMTLTLSALKQARSCIILAVGEDKADAVAGLIGEDDSLPITMAVKTIEDNGGKVYLVVDEDASIYVD